MLSVLDRSLDKNPSCHVCGAVMVRSETAESKGFICQSCGNTSWATHPDPAKERVHMVAITEADRALIQNWIDGDPDHKGISADFWLQPMRFAENNPGPAVENCVMFRDPQGSVFAVRMEMALRLHIQFDCTQPERTQAALLEAFPWFKERAKKAGFSEIVFESVSRPLINFCRRRFGFRRSENELVARTEEKAHDDSK